MKILEFKDTHIEEAAKLFQKTFSQLREKFKFIPDQSYQLDTICSNLEEIIKKNPAFVSIESNKVIGYMTGYTGIKELKGSFSGSYSPEWSHAATSDNKENIYNGLYSAIAKSWADMGNYTHIISFPVNSGLIDIFQMLGFGMYGIDAVREFDVRTPNIPSSYVIERANHSHISQLRDFDNQINLHLESSPIFLKRPMEQQSDEDIINEFLSDDVISLVAGKNNEIIACMRGEKNSGNISILDHKGTFGINFAYTKKEYRKTGIASLLLGELLKAAKNEGCTFSSVDFETQNIEGRYFWLRHFDPLVYSMIRKIDDRIM